MRRVWDCRGHQGARRYHRGSAASNDLAGNPIIAIGIPRKGFGGDGVTDRTAINLGNLTGGIALMTWLPGRKRLPGMTLDRMMEHPVAARQLTCGSSSFDAVHLLSGPPRQNQAAHLRRVRRHHVDGIRLRTLCSGVVQNAGILGTGRPVGAQLANALYNSSPQ
jgi:hypothetical protein